MSRFEEALARDHKKLGRELGLFAIDNDIGKGLPLWLPNGTVVRDELEKLAKELEFNGGYQRVATPHLAKDELYDRPVTCPTTRRTCTPHGAVRSRRREGRRVRSGKEPTRCGR